MSVEPHLADELRALLAEIAHKAAAGQGALAGGRLGWCRRWSLEVLAAAGRLAPLLDRVLPEQETLT